MGRSRRSNALINLLKHQQAPDSEKSYWDDLNRRIRKGKVIPIISNTVYGDPIFALNSSQDGSDTREQADGAVSNNDDISEPLPTVDEQLAMLWSANLNYPFPDNNRLARVAQFNHITSDDSEQAKTRYLAFLKQTLLALANSSDPDAADIVEELQNQVDELSFSDIVSELDYPRFETEDENSLRLLARLNTLPIYVTTSYYDFMERALRAEGRQPRTQICFWRGMPSGVLDEHMPQKEYVPTAENPVVYHLHGYERYPTTLVLSEDDYTDFLVSVSQPIDPNAPIIPVYLLSALAESMLLLLGYRLQDWDFRALFRGIITAQKRIDSLFSLAIQLTPGPEDGVIDSQTAQRYLEEYFDSSRFKVEWGEPADFVKRLWDEWNKVRRAGS